MPISPPSIVKNNSLFKIEIDGFWSASDFTSIFDSINRLYGYRFLLDQALGTLERKGKEYNWESKYETLPEFTNLSHNFKVAAFAIFQRASLKDSLSIRYPIFIRSTLPLSVYKVQFGSKGSIDFLGVGKIFEVIKDLIVNYIPNEGKKLDNIIKEKEIEERDQKIIQMKIDSLKKLGLNTDEILALIGFESLHLDKIKGLIEQKQINNISIEDHPDDE